jgi:hypothetical protein
MLVSGGWPVPATSEPTIRTGPTSHHTTPDPLDGSVSRLRPYHGLVKGERPGSSAGWRTRAPKVRAMIEVVKSAT